MHSWGPLLIKKLDIAVFIYFVILKIWPKLFLCFTLSWPK